VIRLRGFAFKIRMTEPNRLIIYDTLPERDGYILCRGMLPIYNRAYDWSREKTEQPD
jgi:hypothetical protein